ncbi:ATP-binding protein [Gordonibacter urolithinfaciens]|uniref:ATP-binding protein n=1 Tax=Gordonibacter urolithinfaciens TaxID=1335613 RepID=UPI003A8E8086
MFTVLTEKGYKHRVVDDVVARYLKAFGAVCVEGPKWCGKTWTVLNHAESVFYVADPQGGFQNRQLAELDAYRVLEGEKPHAIDEWQEVPGIWDAVRFAVDRGHERGAYLLTGSSVPPEKKTVHSGTGRIARLRMRPMTLFESGESSGEVSLARLLDGEAPHCAVETTLDELVWFTARGGWPGSIFLGHDEAMLLPRQYLQELADRDMSRVDGVERDSRKVERLLRSLARNNQTSVSYDTLLKDIRDEGGVSVSKPTLMAYLDALRRLFVIEDIPAWNPNIRSAKAVRTKVKRHFVDPSLAVAALRATPAALIRDLNTFGFLFETLVTRDVKVYAESLGCKISYYRDSAGREADLIVEADDDRWAAIEVKLGASQIDEAANGLVKLRDKLVSEGCRPPSFLAVVCGLTRFGYRREDGVAVVPLTALRS